MMLFDFIVVIIGDTIEIFLRNYEDFFYLLLPFTVGLGSFAVVEFVRIIRKQVFK